ncbi:MAG: serine protein kinase PrkA [Myxococcota bacterium]
MGTSDGRGLLDTITGEMKRSFRDNRNLMSFPDYFELVLSDPERQLRSSAQYLVDMMNHYGRDSLELPTGTVERFRLFDAPFADPDARVSGHERVQNALYRIFANFARQGRVNKLILLHGPNGSAKSSLVRALMSGLEDYSRLPEGALYSFNWIFPSERIGGGGIGFAGADASRGRGTPGSYAGLSADDIDARIPAEMHDHPIFLIPHDQRDSLLKKLLPEPNPTDDADGEEEPRTALSEYLRRGDLSYKSRQIFDALLASYDGDVARVLDHVQVERFYLSQRYRRGIATIEPQMSVDARIQQLTADRSLASLPSALQHTSLYEPSGPLVDANRGLLEFSDMLKRPVEAFKYLLASVETATVSMDSFLLHLDMVFIASTNETYLDAFKEHPDWPSFKGRMELVKVPYLLRYSDERAIYEPQVTPRIVGKHIAPHAVSVAAHWAVLTRMRKNDPALYPEDIRAVVDSLTPMEKLRLYDRGEVPERLASTEARELRQSVRDLFQESLGYPNYEGRFGASAREIRTALLNAAHQSDYGYLSPLAVLEELGGILRAKGVYEFLQQEVVGSYHDHRAFLGQTEALYLSWVDDEVRESMGLAPEESYEQLFSRYVKHVSHFVKRERIYDPVSGDTYEPDARFMEEIESVLMGDGESGPDFRNAVIGAIGAKALENPDEKPDYRVIFKSYIQKLRDDFFEKRRKVVEKNIENFLTFTAEDVTDAERVLDPKDAAKAKAMLVRLEQRYGYRRDSARDTVAYLLKNKYSE